MKVKLYYSKDSIFSKKGNRSTILEGVEKIHYQYAGGNRIVFEQRDTEFTYHVEDINEFEVEKGGE